MSDVSVVRPSGTDSAAKALYAWAQDTVTDIGSSLHSLNADLAHSAASRSSVEHEMGTCDAVFFFGHGDWDKLLNGSIAVVDTQNVGKAAQGLIIIAIACKSAGILGSTAINSGVGGYLGSEEDLAWVVGTSRQMTGQALVAGPRQLLLNQGTLSDAVNAMQQEFDNIIDYFKYGAGKNNANATLAFLWARWCRNYISVKGNSNATL